jgi:hypothetical protein
MLYLHVPTTTAGSGSPCRLAPAALSGTHVPGVGIGEGATSPFRVA